MKYWNKKLIEMDEYLPGEQPDNLDQYIKLNTNENPFSPSISAIDAIKNSANGLLRRYPDSESLDVRKTFAEMNNIKSENIFMGNGSDEIFTLIFRAFIEPNGLAAFPYPSYSLYTTLAQGNGIKHEKLYLNDDFSYNMNLFLEKEYDLVIIANPNNPTGTYCDPDEIKKFLDIFKGLLVVDEAYIDFYGGSAINLINEHDNIIITRSFSKSYSLAGLRAGLAISNPGIIKGFLKIKDSYNVDKLASAGAAAALMDEKSFNYNIRMLVDNKEYLEERLQGLGFTITPSRANFFFVKHPQISSKDIYEQLKEKKILVRYFTGDIQSEYIRISIGTMMEIKTLCRELQAILEA